MPSILRLSGPLLLLLALLPLDVSAQGGEEFDWIGQPPDRMYPGQLESVGATATSPDEWGTLRGYPFCSAPTGVTCDWDEGEFEGYYPTSALDEEDVYFDVWIGGSVSTGQTLTVTMGVIFEDGDGIQVDSISRDLDVDIRDEYAWAVGIAESTFSADRGATGYSADFRVDKVGAAASDGVTFTCTVIAHPVSLGLADETCTAPSGYTVNSPSSNDTVTVSGIALHEHGDSVHVKLTATSTGDTNEVADTVFRINLNDADVWIRDHSFTQAAGLIAPEISTDVYELEAIDAVSVGGDAQGTCTITGAATCEVRIDNGEEITDTLPSGSYDDEAILDIWVSGSLSEGDHGLALTLDEIFGNGEDSDSLFFTVWDPTPVVTHVSTSDSDFGAGEEATVTFTVEDPTVANGATYDLSATWGGSSSNVSLSTPSVTLNDTSPDQVTVTLTGPAGGRSGVVQLTATRQGGSESDSDQSGVVTAHEDAAITISSVPEDSIVIHVDSTEVIDFKATLHGAGGTGTVSVECDANSDCSNESSVNLSDGMEETIELSVERTAAGRDTVVMTISGTTSWGQPWSGEDTVVVVTPDAPPVAPLASLDDMNAGDRFDRGACLSVAAGPIGIECDDAVFTYLLPPVQTFGQDWPLALNYNSRTAYGELGVALELAPLDSIPAAGYEIVLATDETTPVTLATDTVHIPSGSSLDERYRAVISHRDPMHTTGLHAIKVEVREIFTGATGRMLTLYDTVAVVNRGGSPIGAGWSLSTDEQIVDEDAEFDKLVWVGADGSHRVYRADTVTANLWHSPEPFLGDSITKSDSTYTRHLRGGGSVTYEGTDTARLATMTTAWGRTLDFTHSSSALTAVDVPIPGGDTTGYELHWTGSVLDSVSPAAIDSVGVEFAYTGSGDLESITMADGLTLEFGYSDGLLTTITDADSVVTTIGYTGSAGEALRKVDDVALSATGETTATVDYTPSYPVGADTAVITDSLKAYVDGPRSDVTDESEFWITGWGGARRTATAVTLSDTSATLTTEVLFEDAEEDPRRVTSSTDPRGLTTTFNFDEDGRLETVTADGATTTYTWNTTWELPSRIRGPTDDFRDFSYNTNGLVTKVDYGHDATVDTALRDTTAYDSTGVLVDRATDAEGVWQSFAYDALGNLHQVSDTLGLRSETTSDILGRVSSTEQVMDTISGGRSIYTDYTYDIVGRLLTQETSGESGSDTTVTVINHYNTVGQVDSIQRVIYPANDGYPGSITHAAGYSTLTSYWTYDGFGRVATRTEGTGQTAESFTYDVAGNVVEVTTPRGFTIEMEYDALGRLVEQVVPSVTYAQDSLPDASEITPRDPILDSDLTCDEFSCTFPQYPTQSTSYVISADTISYTYSVGGLTSAITTDTEIRRDYDIRGRMTFDSLFVQGWAQSASGLADEREWEEYGIVYSHDDANRPTTITLDDAGSIGSGADTLAFNYNDASGTLKEVLDRDTLTWEFGYDDARRMTQLDATAAGQPTDNLVTRTYDSSGRLQTRVVTGAGADTLYYTLSGQIDSVSAPLGAAWMNYTDLGHLGSAGYARSGPTRTTIERFNLDALGKMSNQGRSTSSDSIPTRHQFYDSLGRLVQMEVDTAAILGTQFNGLDPDTMTLIAPERLLQWYDAEGNVTWQEYHQGEMVFAHNGEEHALDRIRPKSYSLARNYYDALGRMRARQRVLNGYVEEPEGGGYDHFPENRRGGFEEFVYDALGRRVAIRNRTINRDESTTGPVALDFDGSTRLEAPVNDHVGLGPVRKMTWAFWVDPDGDTSANPLYVSQGSEGGPWWIRLKTLGPDLGIQLHMDRPGGGAESVIHFGDLPSDGWSFIVMEYDGTEETAADRFTAYVDGAEVSWTNVSSAPDPGEAITQKMQALRVGANFDGKMGEILIMQDAIADSATVADWYANGIDFDQQRMVAGYTWGNAESQDPDSVSLADVGELGNDLAYASGSTFPQAPDTTSDYASRGDGGYFDFGGGATASRLNRLHPDLIALDSPDLMTWHFWLNPDSTKSDMDVMGVTRGATDEPVWTISTLENGEALRLDIYNDSLSTMSSTYFAGLEPDSMQFVTIQFRGMTSTVNARAKAWINDVELTKDSTISTVPSSFVTVGSTTRFEVGGFAADNSDTRYFEGELGELAVVSKLMSDTARTDWYTNGIAPLNTGTEPDTVYGVVKHYTWHDELTDQTSMGTDLSVAEGSIGYVTSTYTTNFEATVDTTTAICDSSCANSMTYVMWSGQQVILEDRQRLDFTTTDSTYYGVVSYTHGGGIDRPLAVWRVDEAGDVCTVLPHFNWRGQFTERIEGGVLPSGLTCGTELPLTPRDFRLLYSGNETPETLDLDPVWFGSLLTGSADGTGLQYRRARYYDPLVGQFTQLDPIGMAGGLNLYGYANSDPVNFRDPSGLSAEGLCEGMEGQPVEDCLNVMDSSVDEINALFCEDTFSCWYHWFAYRAADLSAGFGDALSLGGTRLLRESGLPVVGCVSCVDYGSGYYTAGNFGGLAVGLALAFGPRSAAAAGTRFLPRSRSPRLLPPGATAGPPAPPGFFGRLGGRGLAAAQSAIGRAVQGFGHGYFGDPFGAYHPPTGGGIVGGISYGLGRFGRLFQFEEE